MRIRIIAGIIKNHDPEYLDVLDKHYQSDYMPMTYSDYNSLMKKKLKKRAKDIAYSTGAGLLAGGALGWKLRNKLGK